MIIWAFPSLTVGSGCTWLRVRFGAAHSGYRLTITIPNAKFQMSSCLMYAKLCVILLFFPLLIFAQTNISGKVVDAKNQEPLPFVNIIFDEHQQLGATSDLDGNFSIDSPKNINSLTFSYVGYQQKTVSISSFEITEDVKILLTPASLKLQEVVVLPGENPANKIIKSVIENKKINNPSLYPNYKCNIYNKIIYDYQVKQEYKSAKLDSAKLKLDRNLKGGHIFILESITERKAIAPDLIEDNVVANKMSGFSNPTFAALATDVQPFSFYDDYIDLYDGNFLNPISNGSLNKYNFYIEDTLVQEKDSIFILSFKPKPNKNFEALTGLLYINTNKYAIQNVIAKPYEEGLIAVKVEQEYKLIDDYWFPAHLNFESFIDVAGAKELQMKISGRSYIDQVTINSKLEKNDFSTDFLVIDEKANQREANYWQNNRAIPLSNQEKTTYLVIDSIGKTHNFDGYLRTIEKLFIGKLPVKFVDVNIPETFIYNKHEGFRLGINATTNEKLSKRSYLSGFYGYGLKDKANKYGFGAGFNIHSEREFWISYNYQKNLRELGSTELNSYKNVLYDPRVIIGYKMDEILQNIISLEARLFKYAKLKVSYKNTNVLPLYDNIYSDLEQANGEYKHTDINVSLRFAFREKLTKIKNQRVSLGTKFPICYLSYTKGLKGHLGGELDFNKIELAIEDDFRIRNLGITKIRIEGGYIDTSLPYGLMFTGKGSKEDLIQYLVPNYFQTMFPYEFVSDQYVNLFFSHNFGSLIFKTKKFKPQIIVHQNIGWGKLSSQEKYDLVDFSTKEKGFFESGLQLNNLIRFNYFKIAYLGIGVGGFYRYGPYANDELKDNLSLNFNLTMTTR